MFDRPSVSSQFQLPLAAMTRFTVAVLAAGALAACGASQSPDTAPADRPVGSSDPATLGHVHGLGVDPADGQLYAASHFGVFRISEEGAVTQVAGRWQDTMAFTVVGPRTFLGSGHPDLSEDVPPHLGLIESTDAAETWSPISLAGEADFHALEVAGPNTFGYDALSERLLVTRDRESWTEISTTQVIDLAWLGQDSSAVMATTTTGDIVECRVDGRMRAVKAAPPLVLIDSPQPGELVGITAAGEVYSSVNPIGGGWMVTSELVPGKPEAFETTRDAWYAASDRGIYRSTDRGQSWDQVYGQQSDHP